MKKFIAAIMMIALVVVMAVSVSAAEAPATDFEYEVVGEAVTIKKYKGTATEVEIPAKIEGKTVTVIGESAFDNMRTITKIVIPNGVKTIEKKAFYNTRGLTEVAIPDSVETIGESAYYAMKACTKLTIGKGVKNVGEKAFTRFEVLETLTVAPECTALKVENNCLIDVAKKTVLTGVQQETVIIPAGVEEIGYYAFYGPGTGAGKLKNVVISSGVKKIGEQAFSCTDLESVVIPKTVEVVVWGAFANNNLAKGNVYYEAADYNHITFDQAGNSNTANNNITVNSTNHYNACINNPDGWTHSGADAASCTYCNPPAGGNEGGNQGGNNTGNEGGNKAPQTGSAVTLLAVVAVVALAATSVVIKRRIED